MYCLIFFVLSVHYVFGINGPNYIVLKNDRDNSYSGNAYIGTPE